MADTGQSTSANVQEVDPNTDRWSLKHFLWAASPMMLVPLAFGIALIGSDVALLSTVAAILAALAIALIAVVRSIADAAKCRPRLAVSSVLGITASVLGVALFFVVGQVKVDADAKIKIRTRMPEFERMVAAQRTRAGDGKPVRMVVFDEDHSLGFGSSNSFEQILYDETDQIDGRPEALAGYWPHPASPTGVTSVDFGRKLIERIDGHFYHVWIADP